jgi:hypothetical protein
MTRRGNHKGHLEQFIREVANVAVFSAMLVPVVQVDTTSVKSLT